CMQVLQTPFAF
nr:immunoglobulin light chain junction region [Macaca mulatta]